MNKGSMEGRVSNRLGIPTSKGNWGDWVSQSCLQRTHLKLLKSFLKMQVHPNGNFLQECVHSNKGWSENTWKYRAWWGGCKPFQLDMPGLVRSKLVSKGFFCLHNQNVFCSHWRQHAAIPSPWNRSSDRPNPFTNLHWQKKLEIFYQEPKPVLRFLISNIWFPNSCAVQSWTSHQPSRCAAGARLCQSHCRWSLLWDTSVLGW